MQTTQVHLGKTAHNRPTPEIFKVDQAHLEPLQTKIGRIQANQWEQISNEQAARNKFSVGPTYYRLPIVELTIGSTKISCLIDTGSTTTLLDKNALPQYKRIQIKPITFNSLTGQTKIDQEIITEVPKEFKDNVLEANKLQ